MKILSLTAENVKKLTVVEIEPTGNVVQITGRNGQGKTSVLDSIWWALAGSENIQAVPIRKGAKQAMIELKLGSAGLVQMIVERRFTEENSYLTVKTADGAKYPSPQKLLDDVLGALTFDPLSFMRSDGRSQFDVLRNLVDLGIDLPALATADKADYAKRTEINRDAKAMRASAAAIVVPDGLPESDERVDETALLDAIQAAADTNAKIEARKVARANAETGIQVGRDKAAGLREQAATLIAQAVELERSGDDMRKKLDDAPALPSPIALSELRVTLNDARTLNQALAQRDRRKAAEADAEALEKRATDLTTAMDTRAKQRNDALAAAKMPVEGLGFGDGVVTYCELPLSQASDAEQLMISTSIAAALNPKLRVLRIRDGSLLDDDAMKRLAVFADERDMQVWIERVDGSGTVGIVMEDGHVKAAPEQASP